MKNLKFPRGSTAQEDGILGAEGTIRLDMSRGELRVHDNAKQGGHRLLNAESIQALIAASQEGTGSTVITVIDTAALKDIQGAADILGIVNGVGGEEAYVWHPGGGDQGTITSNLGGYWRLLDSQSSTYIRLWRAGMINLQVGGGAPVANQAITAWVDAGAAKLWNGAAYVAATPLLMANMWSALGSYATTITLPNQLQTTLIAVADLNTPTASGWWQTTGAAAHSPVAGAHAVEHRQLDATNAVQIFHVQNSTTQDIYIRYLVAGTWGSWNLIVPSYSLISQAEAEAGVVTTIRLWTAERVKQAINVLAPLISTIAKLAGNNNWTGPQRGVQTAIATTGTVTIDVGVSNDFAMGTMTGNVTLANPTNQSTQVGQKGSITGQQSASGLLTVAYGTNWFPIGQSTAMSPSTAASSKWRLDYHIVSLSRIDYSLSPVGI